MLSRHFSLFCGHGLKHKHGQDMDTDDTLTRTWTQSGTQTDKDMVMDMDIDNFDGQLTKKSIGSVKLSKILDN
jgi:hypothetical protein